MSSRLDGGFVEETRREARLVPRSNSFYDGIRLGRIVVAIVKMTQWREACIYSVRVLDAFSGLILDVVVVLGVKHSSGQALQSIQ